MRQAPSILHLDLDAFFAAVEQRDKPSLQGKPVVIGGIGTRGVVSTASYEAREFGIRSAMSIAEARARCPNAAFLGVRFDAYRAASKVVMDCLRQLSPLVEPLSLDEAFVDLAEIVTATTETSELETLIENLRAQIKRETGGLTCSVGLGTSKLMAKVASELNKPDGFFIVSPGTEKEVLGPLPVTAIPGVGPATAARLKHIGITGVQQVWEHSEAELIDLIGAAAGASLYRLSRGLDDRRISANRENKSVSAEDTFASDLTDRGELNLIVEAMTRKVSGRLRKQGLSGRTVTLKVRYHDFTTLTRSATLAAPTDSPTAIAQTARKLLEKLDVGDGIRLVGVGVSGLADWVQEDLFAEEAEPTAGADAELVEEDSENKPTWLPGMDVHHHEFGDGWVWGTGQGIVTIRFETPTRPNGPILSIDVEDPALRPGHATEVSQASDTVTS
ncbi:MAG TPA: DNA polymerase IV [Aeromicrobium sp.]|nr:DNA polymerase IV [Aeromicrobium sp.]